MNEGFRTFDHTGDLGLEVWSENPERLYALAAEALLAQIAIPARREIDLISPIDLSGQDPADLLVHWLNTALLRAELERAIWIRATVGALTPRSIQGTLQGPRLDPGRDTLLREVKAVSHHDLVLDLTHGACRCRLVLDI